MANPNTTDDRPASSSHTDEETRTAEQPTTDRHRVLVAVDDDVERALTQARYVAALPSAPADVEVVVLYVFDETTGRSIPSEVEAVKSVQGVAAVRRTTEFLAEQGIPVRVRSDSGDTVAAILTQLEACDADCLVLGRRARSWLSSLVFGSVSRSVMRQTDRPVMVTSGQTLSIREQIASQLRAVTHQLVDVIRSGHARETVRR